MLSKKITILSLGAVILVIVGIVGIKTLGFDKNPSTSSVSRNSQNKNTTIVEVNELAKAPYNFLNKNIELRGVVSFVYPESQMIVLIDNKEYANCGVVTCAINNIPVNYSGQMPNVKDFVIAIGALSQTADGKLIFNATKITPQ